MAKSSSRLVSLDIFRGLTVAFMIIVNNPGSWDYVYGPLQHSKWNGCTPADLVFPFFLFIVGMSTWYSLKK
jgi:predicted acyltransferase